MKDKIVIDKAIVLDSNVSAFALAVFCAMNLQAEDKRVSISLNTIIEATGLSRSTVKKSVKQLEQAGYIETKREKGKQNIYHILKGV